VTIVQLALVAGLLAVITAILVQRDP
jgi:hypothetical protein